MVVDLLAMDAKVRWISEGVGDQLNLATSAAQAMHNQRTGLQAKATAWDYDRSLRAQALETVLEALSQQLVPPSLHQTSSSSSLFGSQHSGSPRDGKQQDDRQLARSSANEGGFIRSLQEIRKFEHESQVMNDRTKWKSLRDFVDERGIEEAAERMDADRASLDALLGTTASYPDAILTTIAQVRSNLPSTIDLGLSQLFATSISSPSAASPSSAPKSPLTQQGLYISEAGSLAQTIETLLIRQDTLATNMAHNLESLALHYDQMSQALRDHGLATTEPEISPTLIVGSAETYKAAAVAPHRPQQSYTQQHPRGIDMPGRSRTMPTLADEDMQVFARDTEELPAIIADIETAASEVNTINKHLGNLLELLNRSLEKLRGVMDMLDALAEDMLVKIDDQNRVENESILLHEALNAHLGSFDQLSETYHAYRHAYLRLILEMDRRKRSRDAMEELVNDMVERLDQMRDEELSVREQFFVEQGPFLPDDLCPFVGDQPGRWAVTVGDETLLDLQESVLAEARQNLTSSRDDVPPMAI
ncbi:autophagy protein 17 [Tulasnella sp. JGI-2019a]|nr:autophagy protein 17 [Tulasnella sp. JGI-2019a]KAG9015193.1 autophagy protein 17 [Tulasnella sp. JGI-2019a]